MIYLHYPFRNKKYWYTVYVTHNFDGNGEATLDGTMVPLQSLSSTLQSLLSVDESNSLHNIQCF